MSWSPAQAVNAGHNRVDSHESAIIDGGGSTTSRAPSPRTPEYYMTNLQTCALVFTDGGGKRNG